MFFLSVNTDINGNGKVQLIIINENINEINFIGIFLMKIIMKFKKK
jgi:hypothetical protein